MRRESFRSKSSRLSRDSNRCVNRQPSGARTQAEACHTHPVGQPCPRRDGLREGGPRCDLLLGRAAADGRRHRVGDLAQDDGGTGVRRSDVPHDDVGEGDARHLHVAFSCSRCGEGYRTACNVPRTITTLPHMCYFVKVLLLTSSIYCCYYQNVSIQTPRLFMTSGDILIQQVAEIRNRFEGSIHIHSRCMSDIVRICDLLRAEDRVLRNALEKNTREELIQHLRLFTNHLQNDPLFQGPVATVDMTIEELQKE